MKPQVAEGKVKMWWKIFYHSFQSQNKIKPEKIYFLSYYLLLARNTVLSLFLETIITFPLFAVCSHFMSLTCPLTCDKLTCEIYLTESPLLLLNSDNA